MSTISRRAFLKTVGVGALSVAAMSVLAGCDVADTNVVSGTITGKEGMPMQVADLVTVTSAAPATTLSTNSWAYKYVASYESSISSVTVYLSKTQKEREEAAEAAKKAADKAVENDTCTVKFTVTNYGETPVILTGSMNDSKLVSDAFKATCNGAAVDCTVDVLTAVVKGTPVDYTCTVTLPVNVEEFDITVALPGAKAVKYTFENPNYLKLDPSTAEFYAFNN